MTALADKLFTLARLEAEATPAPWQSQSTEDIPADALVYGPDGDSVAYLSWNPGNDYDPVATAALIAAARNALPELLAVVRAAEAWRNKPYATNSDPEWLAVCAALANLEAKL